MGQRQLHWLVRLFPESYRATRGEELHDALTAAAPNGPAAVKEAMLLCLAACTAWRRFLMTTTGMRNSLFFGLMAWFGILIAVGPLARLRGFEGSTEPLMPFVVAAVLMMVSFVLLLWKRSIASVLGAAGIFFAALSIQQGNWRLASTVPYEARWLGLALLGAVMVRGNRRIHWVVLTSAIPGAMISFGLFSDFAHVPGYRFKLVEMFDTYEGSPICPLVSSGAVRAACTDALVSVMGGDNLAAVVMLLGVIMMIGAWYLPALGVVLIPGALHLTLATPMGDATRVLAYLLLVVAVRLFLSHRSWSQHPWRMRSRQSA